MGIIDFIANNYLLIGGALGAMFVMVTAYIRYTPIKSDDAVLDKAKPFIDKILGLFTKK